MLDIKLIRENADAVRKGLEKRGQQFPLNELLDQDAERRKLITEMEALRERRNKSSEAVGKLKREKKEPDAALIAEMNEVRDAIREKERVLLEMDEKIADQLLRLPNIPDDSIPVGDPTANRVVRQNGTVPQFDFAPKAHWEIGEKLGILDFATAAKLSGARFSLLKGDGALLERALINFMLDVHRRRGYNEILAPYLVNRASMQGTGQLPKFAEELFKCADDDLYLIPTAEVSVTNMHREDTLDEKDLPRKYVSYSACFRREAGSYGKDTRGLIRVHQFNKIELVKFSKPSESMSELEKLTNDAEEILKQLGLAYRVVELSTGDLGFASSKTYDLEVWIPSEKTYREISSCSNFKDFQARRMNIKMRSADNKSKEFVHTLNGSGIAVGRTFAAILENYQQKDGSVIIPEALRPFVGKDRISL
jgi:seryl-tRNA synthetase